MKKNIKKFLIVMAILSIVVIASQIVEAKNFTRFKCARQNDEIIILFPNNKFFTFGKNFPKQMLDDILNLSGNVAISNGDHYDNQNFFNKYDIWKEDEKTFIMFLKFKEDCMFNISNAEEIFILDNEELSIFVDFLKSVENGNIR